MKLCVYIKMRCIEEWTETIRKISLYKSQCPLLCHKHITIALLKEVVKSRIAATKNVTFYTRIM